MLEVKVLKCLLNRDNFYKYYPHLQRLSLEPEFIKLFNLLPVFFDNSDKSACSFEELKALFNLEYQNIKDPETYEDLFTQLEQADIGNAILERMIEQVIYKDVNNQIIQKCMPVLAGATKDNSLQEVRELIDGYDNLILPDNVNEDIFVSDNLDDLIESQITTPGLSWPLKSLQDDIGDLRGDSSGHVFARVEIGKTTFAIFLMNHWAKQLKDDEIGLWICNEESGEKLRLRWWSTILQWPTTAILAQPERAKVAYQKLAGHKVKLRYKPGITSTAIEALIKQYRPRFVVIDQGDNIKTPQYKAASETARLSILYPEIREWVDKYGTDIVTLGQAADTASGKRWLKENMMHNSKIDKPGALDYIIGVGSDADRPAIDLRRYLSVCKNKQGPCGHGRHITMMEPAKSRYTDD